MKPTSLSVSDLLQQFSEPRPTPGGGSAAALAGAVGTALLAMVAGMAKTRTGGPGEREALEKTLVQLQHNQLHLTELIDRDTAAYDAVRSAHRLPKDTGEQQRHRADAIENALRGAIEAPLDVMRASHAAAREALVVAHNGNPAARTDVQVALELLGAAVRGAGANVGINLEGIRDVGYAEGAAAERRRFEMAVEDALSQARAVLTTP